MRQYGDSISNKSCYYCPNPLDTKNLHYDPESGLWSHKQCHDDAIAKFNEAMAKAVDALEAAKAEARAREQAERFGFAPSALFDVVGKLNPPGDFWHKTS